jgi:serine/threonine protein kinase
MEELSEKDASEHRVIKADAKYQILNTIAFDGLTSTYVVEMIEPHNNQPTGDVNSNHQLYIMQEFHAKNFPSVQHCEQYFAVNQKIATKLKEDFNTIPLGHRHFLKLIRPIITETVHGKLFYLLYENVPKLFALKQWFRKRASAIEMTDQALIEQIAIPLIQFLQSVHERGIIHRDINHTSLLIQRTDEGKSLPIIGTWHTAIEIPYIDTKIAPPTIELLLDGEEPVCTPGFFAPEIAMGKRPVVMTDIYAVGAVFYYLFTGGAIRARDEKIADYILEPITKRPDLPHELNLIVKRATQFEPSQRYHSFADFASLDYLFTQDAEKVLEMGLQIELFGGQSVIFIPFDLPKMTIENGGFFRFGRNLDPRLEEIQAISEVEPDGEQFTLAYNAEDDIFLIFEGRNLYATLLNGTALPKDVWTPIDIDKPITIDQNSSVKMNIASRMKNIWEK